MAPRAVQCSCIARASRPGTGHSAKPAASLLAQRGVEPRATDRLGQSLEQRQTSECAGCRADLESSRALGSLLSPP